MSRTHFRVTALAVALALSGGLGALAFAPQDGPPGPGDHKPDFPPFEQVTKGYEEVVSTADGKPSLYTLYVDRKKNRMLAVLPKNYEGQRIFIATSIAGGTRQTGWQWNDLYCSWSRIDDQLVLMQPNLLQQARGGKQDAELRSAVERTYSDRVVTSTKIVSMAPGNRPVIDLDDLLIKNSQVFTNMRGNASLATIGNVKAFPMNLEIPVTMPMGNGELVTLHYSISVIPKTDYKPRESDERIGYFLTVYKDFTKNDPGGDQFVRYVNRWDLQKRDPSLALSPPTEPIVFYIEHTVPVRYRRYVREGILEWNKAFEKVGIIDAIEVRQQDAQTGAFMDIQPEDVRYNFFRWISSETPFAMGPSRVNPETGQILDADIIFDDAMLKNYAMQYKSMIAAYGLDGVDPATLAWIEENPSWDPLRIGDRPDPLRKEIESDEELSAEQRAMLLGDPLEPPPSRLLSRVVQQNLHCSCALGCALQMQTAGLALRLMGNELLRDDKAPTIDGVPEDYLGTILKYITCHEVGHTLGLRHNFKASSWLSVDDYIAHRGQASVGSVMDYVPIYVPPTPESPRGDWMPITIGPYDYWAIEYGYTFDDARRKDMANESSKRELRFATDEDTIGPDPLVARWELGADPLDWSKARMALVATLRAKLLEDAVSDGQAWYLLRQGYEGLLGEQLGALRVASRYVGGVEVNRDRKGTEGGADPLVPFDMAKQREAIAFIIANAFNDDAFDLRPEVLSKLASDKNRHWGNVFTPDEAFSVHDRVAQIQAFALVYLLNPGTLGRVYDNELRTPADQDAITLPELINTVADAVYTELENNPAPGKYTNRQPMISSLRRNLQSLATDRMIDLATARSSAMPAPVRTLALAHLRQLDDRLQAILAKPGNIDDYTMAHLIDLKDRIDRALNVVKVQQVQ
ncbi:MAG: zinc-dependent metalloprotease [Phycisphaerales bacterium]|nr:zinc-dependent metalloprotease [Phycisphaerales bacterium]